MVDGILACRLKIGVDCYESALKPCWWPAFLACVVRMEFVILYQRTLVGRHGYGRCACDIVIASPVLDDRDSSRLSPCAVMKS